MAGPEGQWQQRPAKTWEQMVLDHEESLHSLEAWRSELRGAFGLVRFALGASVVSGLASIIAIVQVLTGK